MTIIIDPLSPRKTGGEGLFIRAFHLGLFFSMPLLINPLLIKEGGEAAVFVEDVAD